MSGGTEQKAYIAFQGEPGAYSHLSCQQAYPELEPLPTKTFEDAFEAVSEGQAALAMIPIENNLGGRVAEVHHLMRLSDLQIIREHFLRVNHHLLAIPDASIDTIERVFSHEQALDQSRGFIRQNGFHREVYADTAGAAKYVAEKADPTLAAIASEIAGQIYGLQSLVKHTQDEVGNTTRFVVLGRRQALPEFSENSRWITSLLFRLSSVPAALYKALGGFATNGVNMIKLESYIADNSFKQAEFYAEVEGHVDQLALQRSLDELRFFTDECRVIGVYPKHSYRSDAAN